MRDQIKDVLVKPRPKILDRFFEEFYSMPKARVVIVVGSLALLGCSQPTSNDIIAGIHARSVELAEQIRNDECAAGTRIPNHPLIEMKMISLIAGSAAGDPNNSVVGSVISKCAEGKNNEDIVCGVVARKNRAGYIDNARRFFGTYFRDRGNFQVKALGESAEKLCNQNGL